MNEQSSMTIRISPGAEMSIDTVRSDDRPGIDDWLDRLKNWETDEGLRSRAKTIKGLENSYYIETDSGFLIPFSLNGSELTVHTLFRKDVLKNLRVVPERTAS